MSMKPLSIFNAVVALGFGVAFMAAPYKALAPYGIHLEPGGAIMTQLFGAALVGIGIIAWSLQSAPPSDLLGRIVLAFFLANAAGLALGVRAMLLGVVNPLGWSSVALYAILAAGYGYFQFVKPKA